MTTRQRIAKLGYETYSRLQGWRKLSSIHSSKWHNCHQLYIKKVANGCYEITVDDKRFGIAKGRENARLLATKFADQLQLNENS